MNWDRDTDRNSCLGIDEVASIDALQLPPPRFEQLTELLAADGPHTAISITLAFSESETSQTSTERQPSMAS